MNVRKILKVLSVSLICIAFLTPIVLQLEANKEFTAYKKEQYLDMLTEFREQLEKIRKSLGAQVRREVPREPVIITEKNE